MEHMQKIALMTWHHVENYGTAYQAYALKSVIQSLGFSVDLIDYRRNCEAPLKQRRLIDLLAAMCHRIGQESVKMYVEPKAMFNEFFEKYFTYTKRCTYSQDFCKLNMKYNGFVCGSDQIWGPEWFDSRFFLDFVSDGNRLIAYAPSFGVDEIHDKDIEKEMSKQIRRFKHLSVRESSGCCIIKKITDRDDTINVLDPVLLLKKNEWEQIEDRSINIPNKYMLLFFLKNNQVYFNHAINLAHMMGFEPIVMHCTQSEDSEYANIENGSPEQLLWLIQNASYVCTDSFHITVLAIIFNREFLVYNKTIAPEIEDKSGRIVDLLRRLEIQGHLYTPEKVNIDMIDYVQVNTKLEMLRTDSIRYLATALKDLQPIACKSEVYCQNENLYCKGCQSNAMTLRMKRKWNNRHILDRMIKIGFSMDEHCYRCACTKNKWRKPIFYDRLQDDLSNDNLSINKIYREYFLTYDISSSINKILKGK